MGMTRHPFVVFSIGVAMPVLGDLRFKLGVPLGGREDYRIVRWRVCGMRQQRAERHRKSDSEAKNDSVDTVRHA